MSGSSSPKVKYTSLESTDKTKEEDMAAQIEAQKAKIADLEKKLGDLKDKMRSASPTRFGKLPDHDAVVSALNERGNRVGIVKLLGSAVQKVKLGEVVHGTCQEALNFLLADSTVGQFRRITLYEQQGDGLRGRFVFWKHVRGIKGIEYLLELKLIKDAISTTTTIKVRSIEEGELPKDALEELKKRQGSEQTTPRAQIYGEFRIREHKLGRSFVTFSGEIEGGATNTSSASTKAPKAQPPNSFRKRMLTFSRGVSARKLELQGSFYNGSIGVADAYSSIEGLITVLQLHFHQPNVIDQRILRNFIDNILPDAPPLTGREKSLLKDSEALEEDLCKSGKRVAGSIKSDVEKFLWNEGDHIWGAFSCLLDISADKCLARMFEVKSYANCRDHLYNHGSMPQIVTNNIDETRGMHYTVGIRFPSPFKPRLFETWFSWKGTKEDGMAKYIIGMAPLERYVGTKQNNFWGNNFQKGSSTGVYIITEVAPLVCRWTRVQTVDLHAHLPTSVLNYSARQQLGWANEVQEQHRRNPKIVDKEIRDALVEKMREGIQASEDQEKVFKELHELFGREEGWVDLESPFEDVKMKINYKQQRRGERSIALGRAECVADCTAEEACAWYIETCSNERQKLAWDDGDSARLEVHWTSSGERRKVNERVFASVKPMPFPLRSREFVCGMIWKTNRKTVTLAAYPVDDVVNYGGSFKKLVRATTKAFLNFTNIESSHGVPQCRVTISQYLDAGGFVPTRLVNNRVPQALGVIKTMANSFTRNEEIDQATFASVVNRIKKEPQTYTPEEEEAITKGKNYFKKYQGRIQYRGEAEQGVQRRARGNGFDEENRENLDFYFKSPDPMVTNRGVHLDNESLATAIGKTVVDASVEECAAHEISRLSSRKNRLNSASRGLTKIFTEKINDHSLYYFTTRDLGVPGFAERDFRTKILWKKNDEDGTIMINVSATNDLDQKIKVKSGIVVATVNTVWIFTPLPRIGDIPQTEVILQSRVNLAGAIPSLIMNRVVSKFLTAVSLERSKFDRSRDIDTWKRSKIVEALGSLEINSTNSTSGDLESSFPESDEMELASGCFPLAETRLKIVSKGEGYGKANFTVPVNVEEAAAYFWDYQSRAHLFVTHDREREIEERKGDWDMLVRRVQRIEKNQKRRSKIGGVEGKHIRILRSAMKLQKTNDDTIVITFRPVLTRSSTWSLNMTSVLASPIEQHVDLKLTRTSDTTTKVEAFVKIFVRASSAATAESATKNALERYLDETTGILRYFAQNVPLEEMTGEVAEVLGWDVIWDGGKMGGEDYRTQDKVQCVNIKCMESKALRAVTERYPWFPVLMARARMGELALNHSQRMKLECITEKEARTIGNNLMPCIKSRKIAKAGIEQWKVQNRAVEELMDEFPWTTDMFVVIGEGIVKAAPWGLMARVLIGAVTSTVDLGTDIFVAYMFWKDDRMEFFELTLGSLLLSMIMQLYTIVGQNKNLGAKKMIIEALPVFFGLKPAVDAYRVAGGVKQSTLSTFNTFEELTFIKGVELFAEAIPAVIIQLMAIATTEGKVSMSAWLSLVASAVSAGFIGATISYDYDTDPTRREQNSAYYGYVPANAKRRTIVFACLTLLSAFLLLIRSMSIVLLGLIGKYWAIGYVLVDLGLYFLVKLLRRDFWYWINAGNFEIIVSFMARLQAKVINDFTSIVQGRHPNEVGGAYWSFGLVMTMGTLPVAIILYEQSGGDEKATTIGKHFAYWLLPSVTLVFVVFFLNIEKGYIGTFFSIQRGKDLSIQLFRESHSDETKAHYSFLQSRHHWKDIEEEVRSWVEANWSRWNTEKPKWFDNFVRQKLPIDLIPSARDRAHEKQRRQTTLTRSENGTQGSTVWPEAKTGGRVHSRSPKLGEIGVGSIKKLKTGLKKVKSKVLLEFPSTKHVENKVILTAKEREQWNLNFKI